MSEIMTEKQQKTVNFICNTCEIEFAGKTKKDVFEFIKEWLPKARQMAEIDNFARRLVGTEIPVYKAKKDENGQWKETQYQSEIALENLKGNILRGKSTIDAINQYHDDRVKYSPPKL